MIYKIQPEHHNTLTVFLVSTVLIAWFPIQVIVAGRVFGEFRVLGFDLVFYTGMQAVMGYILARILLQRSIRWAATFSGVVSVVGWLMYVGLVILVLWLETVL